MVNGQDQNTGKQSYKYPMYVGYMKDSNYNGGKAKVKAGEK